MSDSPILTARGLCKQYGTVRASHNVDLDVYAGEIMAVVGDNGAGKSTAVKMLAGAVTPDPGGVITIDGQVLPGGDVEAARKHGIEMVYQDLALVPNLDVVTNFMLGRERMKPGVLGRLGFTDQKRMRGEVAEELKSLEVNIPAISGAPVAKMSGGQRQCVAVSRAMFWSKRVLILDEPTAALGVKESGAVLRLMRAAADRGIAVIVISHILPHVIEMSDRIVVMRQGEKAAELTRGQADQDTLVKLIVGGTVDTARH